MSKLGVIPVPVFDNADLFAVIGTTFGSADGTHFNVPDMRGVFPKGAGATNRAAGKDVNGNYYSGTLGTYSTDMLQGHWHFIYSYNYTKIDPAGASSPWVSGANSFSNCVQNPVTDGTNGTPRTGLTTEPQSLGLSYIIKY